MRGEALHVGLPVLPHGLPDLLAVVQPQVLHEVRLPHVGRDRNEEVHERLEKGTTSIG